MLQDYDESAVAGRSRYLLPLPPSPHPDSAPILPFLAEVLGADVDDAATAALQSEKLSTVGDLRGLLEPAPYIQQIHLLSALKLPLGPIPRVISQLGSLSRTDA